MNVLPQRQLIAGNAAVVAKWEGVEWEQMFGPALGLFTGRFGDFTPFGWSMEWNAAVWCSDCGCASTHLRKVSGKRGESASPSEGGKGPLGGGTRLYGALAAVVHLRTFGRCAENAGKCLTFGRWERSAGRWNAAVWCSRGGTAFTHLRKVCGKCGKVPHLRKVSGKCGETAHLRKVE